MISSIVIPGSVGQVVILIVIIAAVCTLVFVALRQFNLTIPTWIIQVFLDSCSDCSNYLCHKNGSIVVIERVLCLTRILQIGPEQF